MPRTKASLGPAGQLSIPKDEASQDLRLLFPSLAESGCPQIK